MKNEIIDKILTEEEIKKYKLLKYLRQVLDELQNMGFKFAEMEHEASIAIKNLSTEIGFRVLRECE